MNEKDLLRRYRAMQRWVERERRRLGKTEDRKSQRYLQRSRMLLEVDLVTFRELVRELFAVVGRRGRT